MIGMPTSFNHLHEITSNILLGLPGINSGSFHATMVENYVVPCKCAGAQLKLQIIVAFISLCYKKKARTWHIQTM